MAVELTLMRSSDNDTCAPARRRLEPGEVHVWRTSLDDQPETALPAWHALLASDEAARAAQFRFPRDRRRFVVGRGMLRILLGGYLGCPAAEVALCYGPNEKPMLVADPEEDAPLHFNVAHAGSAALFAFTRVGQVGIDLERLRDVPEWEHIAATQFTAAECARVRAASDRERPGEFLRAWTRREAFLKAHGVGLGGAVPDAGRIHRDPFVVHEIPAPPGFVAAMAVSPTARWLTLRPWEPAPALDPPLATAPAERIPLNSISAKGTDSP